MKNLPLILLFLGFLISCPEFSPKNKKVTTSPEICEKGTKSCPCATDARCFSDFENDLECYKGFCVTRKCQLGSEGCACFNNKTCAPKNGIPMTCEGGVCKETKLPDPGTLGGSCDQKNSCKTFQSKALECNLGRCELPGCKSGSIGCPCDPFGKCEEFGGESLSCFNNFCVKGGCKEGELGCPCKKDKKCNDPKNSCDAGLCLKPNFYDLSIDNPKARSCDFLLEDKNTLINSVEYKGQVLGKWKKRANKTALSFIAREDKGLKGEILKINVEKGLFKAENAFNRLKSICYDRLGNPLERIEVKIK